jgi:hypothetical protein
MRCLRVACANQLTQPAMVVILDHDELESLHALESCGDRTQQFSHSDDWASGREKHDFYQRPGNLRPRQPKQSSGERNRL